MDSLPFQLPTQVGTELFPDTVRASAKIIVAIEDYSPNDPTLWRAATSAADAILTQNQPQILGYLLGQRGNALLSGLGVYGHAVELGGVGISYTSQFGNETVRVSVLGKAIKNYLGMQEEMATDLFQMCVFYSGNRIAIWPMGTLKSGKIGKPAGKWTLRKSDWGRVDSSGKRDTTIRSTQLKISRRFHPIVADVSVVKGIIKASPAYTCRNTLTAVGHEATLSAGPAVWPAGGSQTADSGPIINGQGDVCYAVGGNILRLDGGRISVDQSPNIDDPFVITQDGEYYSVGSNGGMIILNGGTPSGVSIPSAAVYGGHPPTLTTITNGTTMYIFGPGRSYSVAYGGYYVVTSDPHTGYNTYTNTVDMGLTCPFMSFSCEEGLDLVSIGRAPMTLTDNYYATGRGGPTTESDLSTGSFCGVLVEATETTSASAEFVAWPYWVSGIPYCLVNRGVENIAVTPYGEFPMGGSIFRGNFHASNGKHVVQSFDIPPRRYIFLNGVDVGDDLATALGVEVGEIDCVWLDMRLSQIRQLIGYGGKPHPSAVTIASMPAG